MIAHFCILGFAFLWVAKQGRQDVLINNVGKQIAKYVLIDQNGPTGNFSAKKPILKRIEIPCDKDVS